MNIAKLIDATLNRLTMYKIVLYGLGLLAAVAILFGFAGTLAIDGVPLLTSLAVLVTACYAANWGFAKLYHATTNAESAVITALILFCIFSPPTTAVGAAVLAAVGVLAMASKYVVAWCARHLFNPAAFAAFAAGLLGLQHASWWIATDAMLPFVLLVGLLVVRKLRRFHLLLGFLVPAFAGIVMLNAADRGFIDAATAAFVSYPILFLGTIMLTEPLTTPPTRRMRIAYGAVVGLLVGFAPWLHIGSFYMAPEVALLLGNLFAYATLPRKRLPLSLVSRAEIAPGIYDFRFASRYPFRFTPGQYMEVTLPIRHPDIRGNRRTFSIASSPEDGQVAFGIRIMQPASSFKAGLMALRPGDHMYGQLVGGDFTLPQDTGTKLAFIAGGIGITPFRSQLAHIAQSNTQRDIVLFYQATAPDQFVYRDVLERAASAGLRTVYVLAGGPPQAVPAGWAGQTGFITKDMLEQTLPDYRERTFYISGPPAMVDSYKAMLRAAGVARARIMTDHFSGY